MPRHVNQFSSVKSVPGGNIPEKQQPYLPPISKTIQIRRTRHARHSGIIKEKLISDVLMWTPSHGRARVERPTRTYLQKLCIETGCSIEDLPGAMDDSNEWCGERWSEKSVVVSGHDDDKSNVFNLWDSSHYNHERLFDLSLYRD